MPETAPRIAILTLIGLLIGSALLLIATRGSAILLDLSALTSLLCL